MAATAVLRPPAVAARPDAPPSPPRSRIRAIRQRLPTATAPRAPVPAKPAPARARVAEHVTGVVVPGATTVTEPRSASAPQAVVVPRPQHLDRGAATGAPGAAPERDRSPSAIAPGPAPSSFPQLPYPAEGGPFVARPAPTRTAVLAAFEQATRPARAAAPAPAAIAPPVGGSAGSAVALAVAAPAPAIAPAPLPSPLMRPAPLSRVTVDAPVQSADAGRDVSRSEAAPAAPDLDALADYVLERLRHELRDGRERLGFLLDDAR